MTTDATPPTNNGPLVRVVDLKKHFPIREGLILQRTTGYVRAVDGISFDIAPGETLGLVGESGCGKSTAGRTLLGLYPATEGSSTIAGRRVQEAEGEEWLAIRRQAQMIFQDPFASLNPRWTVSAIIGEPLRVHNLVDESKRTERVKELMALVGLDGRYLNRFPHEFSGGQRQRIGIARALALRPRFIVCDEPVSALDVSVQSAVLNLLRSLQSQFGLTYLFIAHNLSVVEHISDRVGVMYLGKMVEVASRETLFRNPMHPYTQALLSAIPMPDPDYQKERIVLTGDVPSPLNPPSGCRFHPRCPRVMDVCKEIDPPFEQKHPDHWVACHLYTEAVQPAPVNGAAQSA